MAKTTKGARTSNRNARKNSQEQADIFNASNFHFNSVKEWFAAMDRYETADAFCGNWRKQRKCRRKSVVF